MSKPINKAILYTFAFWLYSTLMYGCGSSHTAPGVGGIAPNASESRSVQLNAQQFTYIPSSVYTLPNDYYVQAPQSLQVVGGTFSGSPGQYLHARLVVGGGQCEYQATSTTATELVLGACAISADSYDMHDVIELQAYDAPGLLLEAHVTLSR